MGTARCQFTDEFKREAVGLLASSRRPLSQIAQNWGLPLRGFTSMIVCPFGKPAKDTREVEPDPMSCLMG